MIYLAILINRLGHFIPTLIHKKKFRELRCQLKWRQILYELSGLIISILLAFLIIAIITLSSTDRYLLNENAIYGVNCSSIAKEMGFKDGDKILTINDKLIERFSEITPNIVLEYNAKVKVLRNEQEHIVEVDDSYIIRIIKENVVDLFTPRLVPIDSSEKNVKQLIITESKKDFGDAIHSFRTMVKQVNILFNPTRDVSNLGGYVVIKITDFKSFLMVLALNLILVGLFCLLPIPGFEVGNAMIAFIEKIRKKNFNLRKLKILRITCVIIIMTLFILNLYLF